MSPGIIITAFLVVFAVVLVNHLVNRDPANEACAREIARLLADNPHADASEVIDIFIAHRRTPEQAGKVSAMVPSRLPKNESYKNDKLYALETLRRAADSDWQLP